MGAVDIKVTLLRHTAGAEELLATAARVCYSARTIEEIAATVDEEGDWVGRLARMGHHSPLEHAVFTFGVEGVSRSLLAQVTRHRIASFSVRSQRYVGETGRSHPDGVFSYVVPQSIQAMGPAYVAEFAAQMEKMQEWYNYWVEALGGGRSTYEDARYVLPNAAATSLVVTMNARELRHFFRLRLCQRAQWEIRDLADKMLELARAAAPRLFDGAGPACVGGACPEGEMTCGRLAEVRRRYASEGGE
ncbi:MAG TPA: FAD-dependent thymidylate synthase [Spirochaetia bacterium]|nr:FAD-dependent thymidylate synthase [Spirochaetia bacterium]